MLDTKDCKIPSTWTCITQTLVPFISPYPSVCIISHRFHISSDMTCLQSKAFAETQCHQLITSFALRKVACTNWICNTSVVQHKMPGRNLHMKRITQPLFLPIIKGSLLGIAWLVDTFHQKKLQKFAGQFPVFFCCVHIIFISTHLKTHQTYPAQKLTWQRKISTHLKMYRSMSYWKMAIFLHFPRVYPSTHQGICWVNSTRAPHLHEFQVQYTRWIKGFHLWRQQRIGINLENPIEICLQLCYVSF